MEYYRQFPTAILHLRGRSIVLLTLSPLTLAGSLDLHALTTPPAFNLSQDQTLQLKSFGSGPRGWPDRFKEVFACNKPVRARVVSGADQAGPTEDRPFGPSQLPPSVRLRPMEFC